MRKIPWKGIAIGCLVLALLVAARSAVTVGKALYYRVEWVSQLVEDPWFIVGIVAAVLGILALLMLGLLQKKDKETLPAQWEEALEEIPDAE